MRRRNFLAAALLAGIFGRFSKYNLAEAMAKPLPRRIRGAFALDSSLSLSGGHDRDQGGRG